MQLDPRHFARAVTELGERRAVVASTAIYNTQGLKVLDKGVAIDARLFDRLSQHQLRVPLAECVDSAPGVSGLVLREAALVLARTEPAFDAMLGDARSRDILLTEIGLIPLPRAIAFQLTLMRESHPNLWAHSLRAMLVAGSLGLRRGAPRHDVRLLAAAGLLHDLGMLHIDPVLLRPEIELTREQRRQLYTHPLVVRMLLERHHEYTPELMRAALEHHEALDGSGYPRALEGDAISPWGQILAVAEVVSAILLPDRPLPGVRLSLVLRMNRHRFDPELVGEVLRRLPAEAPSGTPAAVGVSLQLLRQVDRLLRSLAAARPATEPLPPQRADGFEHALDACVLALRTLARAGVTEEQLATLDEAATDPQQASELALLAHEAAWQLRSVTRQARRRWRLEHEETFPGWLQQWLDEAVRLVVGPLGPT